MSLIKHNEFEPKRFQYTKPEKTGGVLLFNDELWGIDAHTYTDTQDEVSIQWNRCIRQRYWNDRNGTFRKYNLYENLCI